MGFFGTYLYGDGSWTEVDPDAPTPDVAAAPWLHLDIHDSDFAAVRYAPHADASGVAYLGFTPRTYFEDEAASAPTDTAAEAAGLAFWARAAHTSDVRPEQVQPFLAVDGAEFPEDDAELDDADVFVELKSAQFVALLGLPNPIGG